MNNENKKLSRNRKRRIERKIEMDDKMKSFLKKYKSDKKNNIDRIKHLEIELVKIKDTKNLIKLEYELKKLNNIQVVNKNLHEKKQKIIRDHAGEFEMVGSLKVGDQTRPTHTRVRNKTDYEAYINSIDGSDDAEDSVFIGYFYKINTPQFNKVNRSQYGNGCYYKHEKTEYPGKNCFIPTKGYFFVKCSDFITGEDYKQQYLDFIRNEKRRSNIKTKARIQQFCRANKINLGFLDGMKFFLDRLRLEIMLCFCTIINFV